MDVWGGHIGDVAHRRKVPPATGLTRAHPASTAAGTPPRFVETPSSLPTSWGNPKLCGRDCVSSVDFRIFRVWELAWAGGDRIWGQQCHSEALCPGAAPSLSLRWLATRGAPKASAGVRGSSGLEWETRTPQAPQAQKQLRECSCPKGLPS